jgi:hypothetical protein
MDYFRMANGHPVYNILWPARQTLRWPVCRLEGLRIEIAEPTSGRCWSLDEIEVLEQPEPATGTPR